MTASRQSNEPVASGVPAQAICVEPQVHVSQVVPEKTLFLPPKPSSTCVGFDGSGRYPSAAPLS